VFRKFCIKSKQEPTASFFLQGAAFLDWSVQLGACSSYSVEEADGVQLEASKQAIAQAHEVPRSQQRLTKRAQAPPQEGPQAKPQQQPAVKMLFHAQVRPRGPARH
jgi:hypothetical protein